MKIIKLNASVSLERDSAAGKFRPGLDFQVGRSITGFLIKKIYL